MVDSQESIDANNSMMQPENEAPVVKRRPKQKYAGPPKPLVIVVEHCINCASHQYCTRHVA